MQMTGRGMFHFRSSRNLEILVYKWHENNIVTVDSSAVDFLTPWNVERFSQLQNIYRKIDQAAIIKFDNENVSEIDWSDQNIGLYRTSL